MNRLNGKTAVITGGATGIGLASAKRFVDEGAFVFIFGRRQDALDAAVAQLGSNARGIKGSVSDEADLDRLYTAVKAERGSLDIVFANAGAGNQAKLGEITAAHIDEHFDTNVKGVLFTVQKALPLLKDGASVILTSSTTSISGTAAFSVYSATKAAVRNFARNWILDLKDRHIRVNAVSPGVTDTAGLDELFGGGEQAQGTKAYLASLIPAGRVGQPEEIAKAVLFLASDDASFVNGIELFVDGGQAQI